MRDVFIRVRSDGVTELTPKLAPLHPDDRWLVIFSVVITAGGFFLAGLMPALAFAAVVLSGLAGEVFLALKALALALLRPQAEVLEVPRFGRRRG